MIFIIMIKLATLKILTWEITFKVLLTNKHFDGQVLLKLKGVLSSVRGYSHVGDIVMLVTYSW